MNDFSSFVDHQGNQLLTSENKFNYLIEGNDGIWNISKFLVDMSVCSAMLVDIFFWWTIQSVETYLIIFHRRKDDQVSQQILLSTTYFWGCSLAEALVSDFMKIAEVSMKGREIFESKFVNLTVEMVKIAAGILYSLIV